MAFTTGTATDYLDLLSELRTFLVAEGWTELNHVASSGGTAMQPTTNERTTLRGPGAGAGMEAYVDILTAWNAGLGTYSWRLRSMTDYIPGAAWSEHTNSSPETWLNLWANTIDYWFYVSDRRFIVVAKCGSNYMSMYAGLFLPFALPSEYPMPMLILGNYYTEALPSKDNAGNRMIADPGVSAGYYLRRSSETWATLGNHLRTDNVNAAPACGNGYTFVWPHGTSRGYGADNPDDWNQNGFLLQRPNANDELPLFQCHLIDPTAQLVIGGMEGVYSTGGHDRAPEQVVTFDSQDYRLFPNVFRSTANDFMAIEEL